MEEQVTLINEVLNCDRYNAEAKINEGSYGQIFKVRHKVSGQVFALKAMQIQKLHKMQKIHEVAIEEVILKKVKHPGIVKLQEVIYAPKYIGMVMQLCPFGDFFKLMGTINRHFELAKKKRKIIVYYLAQVLQTIDYLHSNFIIHRDLKPENIVLGKDLRVRVIDFGTAKITSPEGIITKEEIEEINRIRAESDQAHQEKERQKERVSFVGTANYLSPQGIDLHYSGKNDIWALGILAYKFYFNKLPYEGHDSLEIFKKIKVSDLPLQKGVQPDFQEFFKLTLCKDPEQRPSSSQLKKIKLFSGINFSQIFGMEPPISKEELSSEGEKNVQKKVGSFLFEHALEKRMFFGNYKPRYLTIQKVGTRLLMAYRYIPSKKVKHEFELNMNDYAQAVKNNEFEVVTTDKRYHFRLGKNSPSETVAADINAVIRSRYSLE